MTSSSLFFSTNAALIENQKPCLMRLMGNIRFCSAPDDAVEAIKTERPDTIFVAFTPSAMPVSTKFVDLELNQWMTSTDDGLFDLFSFLRDVKTALGDHACSLVLLGSSLAMTGAKNDTALATLYEGQRGLMKSLARQWGGNLSLNYLSVWPALLHDDFPRKFDDKHLAQQPELGEYIPSLGARPDHEQLAKALTGLAQLGQSVTGQTIIMDGGEWMLP